MKKELPYANIMVKLDISRKAVNEIVAKLGWGEIPECHFVEKKIRRGRPKTKVAVSDSDEEDKPKKKRGRPKKEVKGEPTDEELLAALAMGI